jgi:cytochrome c-type biogenesis protein CcmH
MLLVLVLATMTLAVLATVVLPLANASAAPAERVQFDRAVYRDQLRELERDIARGLVPPTEAQATRLELERRLLATDAGMASPPPQSPRSPRFAVLLALLVVAGAGGLYWMMGSPSRPDLPIASRSAAREQDAAGVAQMNQIRTMVAGLAQRLAANPDDADGWLRLGRAYAVLGERDKAVDAYEHAQKLAPNDGDALLGEAEAMLQGQPLEQKVPDPVLALLRRSHALKPGEPMALWYLGLAAAQDRRFDEASDYWRRTLDALPADSPDRQSVTAALSAIAGK